MYRYYVFLSEWLLLCMIKWSKIVNKGIIRGNWIRDVNVVGRIEVSRWKVKIMIKLEIFGFEWGGGLVINGDVYNFRGIIWI